LIRDRADQLQKLEMISIPNFLCALMHRGTDGQGLISTEKICVTADGGKGACGGKLKLEYFVEFIKTNLIFNR
jgi:hypothetical protein